MSQSDYFYQQDNSFGNWQTLASYDALYMDIGQSSGGTGIVGLSNNRFYSISGKHMFHLQLTLSDLGNSCECCKSV